MNQICLKRNENMRISTKTMMNETSVHTGSLNVFADLGFKNPDLELAKVMLVSQLQDLIDARKLTQSHAATLLGLDQPKVSALLRGRTSGYSLDRLFKFLTKLGQRVEIRVRQAKRGKEAEECHVVVV